MKNSNFTQSENLAKKNLNLIVKFSSWVNKQKVTPRVLTVGMVVMLIWAGLFKMTAPGAESITPLVANSPFISWHFKVFGALMGSTIIGTTEVIAALLMVAGQFKPQIGIVGGIIATIMFFTTSTMIITTPGALINVNGVDYMSFLGLFLFKDLISLGVSFYLVSHFGQRASYARLSNKNQL